MSVVACLSAWRAAQRTRKLAEEPQAHVEDSHSAWQARRMCTLVLDPGPVGFAPGIPEE